MKSYDEENHTTMRWRIMIDGDDEDDDDEYQALVCLLAQGESFSLEHKTHTPSQSVSQWLCRYFAAVAYVPMMMIIDDCDWGKHTHKHYPMCFKLTANTKKNRRCTHLKQGTEENDFVRWIKKNKRFVWET